MGEVLIHLDQSKAFDIVNYKYLTGWVVSHPSSRVGLPQSTVTSTQDLHLLRIFRIVTYRNHSVSCSLVSLYQHTDA